MGCAYLIEITLRDIFDIIDRQKFHIMPHRRARSLCTVGLFGNGVGSRSVEIGTV